MRDNPIHTFLQVLSGNLPDQLNLGGHRWFEVVFYWVLLLGSFLIGLYNDPTEWPWTYVGIICAHGMFSVAQAGRSLGIDNLLAKRLAPGIPYDGVVARATSFAS